MRPPRRRRYGLPLAGLLLIAVALRLALAWHLRLPVCALKEWTGLPCPLCGSTRALAALANLDWAQAAQWNPLTFLACVVVALWSGVGLIRPDWPMHGATFLREHWGPRAWGIALAGIAANWLYLLQHLPR